jgi:putative lysine transport system permease protein
MSLDLSYAFKTLIKYWPMFWYGIKLTLSFAIVGTVGGFVIGLLVGAIRAMAPDPLDSGFTKFLKQLGRVISGLYIWIFRGTPMMIQAVFLYYLLRPVLNWTPITAGMIIISINTGAYMAEIIRSGLQSVDPGQTEAAKSIGMSNFQTLMFVIFPQAIKNTFPSIGNQLIVNIKDSCMLNAIAVTELYFQTTSVAGTNMRYVEVYLVSAILYLCLTTLATWLLNFIERRINHTTKVSTKEFSA